MEDVSSATDISSSLSEFIRKEKLLKELYQDGIKPVKSLEFEKLKYNDEEIDGILQQMGRLLSPEGEEVDNSVYKHVIEETENKSIEQILNEAKELVRESTPICETSSFCMSTDDLTSECTESEVTYVNVKNGDKNENYVDENGNQDIFNYDEDIYKDENSNSNFFNGSFGPRDRYTDFKKKSMSFLQAFTSRKNKNEQVCEEIKYLRKEVTRFSQLYSACQEECSSLRKEIANLQYRRQVVCETHSKFTLEENLLGKEMKSLFRLMHAKIGSTKENV